MLRILIFIFSAVLVAGLFTYLLSIEGRLDAEAFGQRLDIENGVAALLLVLFVAIVVMLTTVWNRLAALPASMRRREAEARRERGLVALARGFEAAAIGDAGAAQQQARIAGRNLDDVSLTRFLAAKAAQLAGDEKTAGEAFAAMLEAPDTEFLGLQGLYALAIRANDREGARRHAERAFRLRPTAWAFESMFELGLERGAWREMREAIAVAHKHGLISSDRARRGEAALLSADADAAGAAGDNALALRDADAALKLAPGFAPAAVLAARLHASAGKKLRATKILEHAFSEDPHPAVARAHDDLYTDGPAAARAEAMRRLAQKNPGSRESQLALARAHILLGECRDAMTLIEPLLAERATGRDFALMAEAVAGAHEGEAGETLARAWLRRAAAGPRDPLPGAEGSFHFTREGWARLVAEYMEHARLAPPPLEDGPPGLSAEELRRLAPPERPAIPVSDEGPHVAPRDADQSTASSAAPPVEDIEKIAAERARAIDAARKVS